MFLIEKNRNEKCDYFLVCDYNQIPYIKKAAPNSNFMIHSTGLDIDGLRWWKSIKPGKYLIGIKTKNIFYMLASYMI